MVRDTKTATEILGEVQRLVDMRKGDGEDIVAAHLPVPLAEPDESGCNWTMLNFTGDRVYFRLVGIAVLEVQAKWNLG